MTVHDPIAQADENDARLLRMAEQIARAVAHQPDPAAATAEHINAFWDPRMRARLTALADAGTASLSETLSAAVPSVRRPA